MFEQLPIAFREHGLKADVRTLLYLQKAIQRDLVRTLGDIFNVLKGVVAQSPEDLGPFTKAFYEYFLHIDLMEGESIEDSISRSETFRKWRDDNLDRFGDDVDIEIQVRTFLDDVHLTSYDIKEVINGRDLWDKDRGDLKDEGQEREGGLRRPLDKMADYSDLSLEELLARMEEVMEQQKGQHEGGSHWIGSGGISPYGFGGAAKDGIRVGGAGGGKMARRVLNDRSFFPVDLDEILNDNNVDAALSSLRGVIEESSEEVLDIPGTIDNGLKRGGLFLPELISKKEQKLQVLLFIDNGGYSMNPYIRVVRTLFRKMKTRFAHDLETYYFHNTVYDRVYTDASRTKAFPMERILTKDPNYSVFFIGDAAMAAYELNKTSLDTYRSMRDHFPKITWLNPEPQRFWGYTFSIQVIKELIPMYPMSPRGIEEAVRHMNRV